MEKRAKFCSFTLVMMLCANFCCLVWKKVGSLLRYRFMACSAPTSSPLARKSSTALKYSSFALGAVSLFCMYLSATFSKICMASLLP